MTDTSFLDRELSFSLLYFTGDVYGHIPGLLSSCNYAILADQYIQAPFFDLFDSIGGVSGLDNSIVYKATYKISNGAILLDPEMVIEGRTDELTRFCAKYGVETYTAIWERYSQTVRPASFAKRNTRRLLPHRRRVPRTSCQSASRFDGE